MNPGGASGLGSQGKRSVDDCSVAIDSVLHARKAGWLSSWLLHFSNVVGGVIIAFAWWGVNMLGVGLHSYGFTSGRDALDMFYGAEAVLCVLFIILHYRALRRVDIR